MCDLFAERYASCEKQTEIFDRLDALIIDEVKKKDDDNCAILDKLTKRISELALMVHEKDRGAEAKVRFLTKAVIGFT